MRNVDADETHVALLADRDSMDLGADSGMAATFGTTLLERDGARGALRQWPAPARHLRSHVERPDHVGLVGKIGAGDQLAAIAIRVFAGRVGKLVHEAFAIEVVRRLTHAASGADGNVEGLAVGREAIVRRVVARA